MEPIAVFFVNIGYKLAVDAFKRNAHTLHTVAAHTTAATTTGATAVNSA